MSDAVSAVERLLADDFFEVAELAFGAANLQAFTVAGDGDSGRVVATIFQLSQALDDDGDNLFLTHISHNAAHECWLLEYSVGDPALFRRNLPATRKHGNLFFEGETELFNDRVRQNFARHFFNFGVALRLWRCRH